MFNINDELKNLPDKPGVYIMKDINDEVIYVGKAKVLKNRVRQYFQNSSKHCAKVRSMVKNISYFEYIVTHTEVEALILENNLIKKFSPKYNIMLKDDKTYPYIKITTNEIFPKIFLTRVHKKDKAKYFGPYTNSIAVKEYIDLIQSIWPLKRCMKVFPRDFNKDRPCLNYHIGKCKAPCNKLISKDDYDIMVNEVVDFLNGKDDNIIKKLNDEMKKASEELEFEKASEIRDKIKAIKKLNQKQITESTTSGDSDVIAFARAFDDAIVQIFFIRSGKITGREHFMFNNIGDFSRSEIITNFIKQFYSGTPFIPKEIIVQEEIEDKQTIIKWLSDIKGQKVIITTPKKGEKLKLIELVYKNALITLDKFIEEMKREHKRTIGALNEIKEALGINFNINRIESYDISNIQGFESVASMVVFEYGKPKRSDYRKFKIKSVIGPNDYFSIDEVITRRFSRYIKEKDENVQNAKFSKLPDIIFIDGGKGQITAVQNAMAKININIPVCGMIKDDHHKTKGIIYNNSEILLKNNSEGFKLITRIQDEVHRFAIEYHRKLRQKNQIHSILDDIKGVGEKRRKILMKHFKDIEKIRNASVEELAFVDGINYNVAENIYNFFRS